jgi:Acetyltransferase (GNAT) domain
VVYAATMQRNGVLARSRRFFEALWETLLPLDLMRLWVARHHGRIVSGVLVVGLANVSVSNPGSSTTGLPNAGGTAFYAFGGSLEEAECAHANDLLHWEAIHDACRVGFRTYDFGEVPEGNAGLARFKSKWNTRAVRLQRYYYPAPQVPGGESSHSRLRAVSQAIWRHLPGGLAIRLSDWLYGYL